MKTALLWAHRLANPLEQMTGIGRHVAELVTALHADEQDWTLAIGSRDEPGFRQTDFHGVPISRMSGPRHAIALSWMALGWPPAERCGVAPAVVHVLNVSFPVPTHAPAVYTLHDLMLLTHPEWYGRLEVIAHRRALGHAARHAAGFVAISSFVADEAAERLRIPRERITVVPLGVSAKYRSGLPADHVAAVCHRVGVEPNRFVIALGAMTTRKNLSMLLEAFAVAGPALEDVDLLFAGPSRDGAQTILRRAADLGIAQRVRVVGFVDEEDLPALLTGARALAHPSLDEGFGLPPVEAMAVGTPTVVSSVGALPEVVGDASLLVPPSDPEAWAAALTQVVVDESERARLIALGLERAAGYRWDRAARQTRAVWDQVVARKSA